MRLALLLTAALLVAVACGGGSEEQEVVSAGKDVAQSTQAATETATATATRTATPTIPPTPTATATATPKAGTRENPIPMNAMVDVADGWQIGVIAVKANANADVAARNQFNKPPEPGNQFLLATVRIKRTAAEPKSFLASMYLKAVGASAVSYSTYENRCGVIPGDFPSSELFQGGQTEGNVCWQVKSSDVDSLVLYYDPISFDKKDRLYFKLQ